MKNNMREYASALFDVLLENNRVDEAFNEFKVIVQSFDSHPELYKLFDHPKITRDEKKLIVDKVYGDANQTLKHFLYVLVDNNKMTEVDAIYQLFIQLYNNYNQVLPVDAVTTVALSQSQISQIELKLTLKYRRKISLSNTIDQSILGGIRLRVQGEVIDHSLTNHLTNLKSFVLRQY